MKLFIIILSILIVIILTLSYFVYRITFYNERKGHEGDYDFYSQDDPQYKPYANRINSVTKDALNEPFKEICIDSFDGKKIYAKYYEYKKGAPIILMAHGYKSNAVKCFPSSILDCKENGYNALIITFRGHDKSDGRTFTFGIKDRVDIKSWCDYIIDNIDKDAKIILLGISMGAASVLMSSNLSLPSNVKGIIADCPYSNVKGIIFKVAKDKKLEPKYLYPFLLIGSRIFANFNINETSCYKAIKDSKLPILIIHGTDDHFVPASMSIELKQEFPKKIQLELFKNAGHGMSFFTDETRYKKLFHEFIKKNVE